MRRSEKYKPIVFVNNPITKSKRDVIGFNSQVETLQCAMKNGANMIGIIADYGSGKSSMTELLVSSMKKKCSPKPIKINMWDCLNLDSNDEKVNSNISILTKSFLYQLANGYKPSFGRYINKILSKNYGNLSFAINKKRFWIWFIISGLCYTAYQIFSSSGSGIMQHIPVNCGAFASYLKFLAPIWVLFAILFIVIGIKDTYIAFSHWNMPHRREPEISDIFDIYSMIIKRIKPPIGMKRVIFVDDLDRVNEKKLIEDFLKELYRFQDSFGKYKSRFVFIISIKPESELKPINDSNEVYSKIFDLTLSLKPIHFDDYDSLLLELLKCNRPQKKKLEKLLGHEISDSVPESFRWIKRGTNLTLRDLKERLNQAISIMISLKNKNYKVKTAVTFEACAAVSYLENKYPKDYYSLIKSETEFACFIQNSRDIIDRRDDTKDITQLKDSFNIAFNDKEVDKLFSDKFVNELCEMVISGLFNDDFRMYFYTYPKESPIKTTDENTLYNYFLFPNSYNNFEKLDEVVNRVFENGQNLVVENAMNSSKSFPPVIIENDTLFLLANKKSVKKTFDTFVKKVINSDFDAEDKAIYWKRTLVLPDIDYKEFVTMVINNLVGLYSEPDLIVANRMAIIKGIGKKIRDYKGLYISVSHKIPQITKEEIELINNVDISLQLVDINNLKEEYYKYLIPVINSKPLIFTETFDYALKIWLKSGEFFLPVDIGEDLLEFLSINQFVHDDLFAVVSNSCIDNKKIAGYLNKTLDKPFSREHLKIIDDLGFENDISEDRLRELLDNGLYFTPLLYCSNNNCLSKIDNCISNVIEILKICERISNVNEEAIVKIRKYLYKELIVEEYKVLYYTPYPLITRDEYADIKEIDLIDASQVDEENYEEIINVIHSREYSPEELVFLVKWIFDENTNENCIMDSSLRKDFFVSLDFKILGMKKLNEEQRNEIYTVLEEEFAIKGGESAIDSLKHIGCLIPAVEEIVQTYASVSNEYCKLIAELDEMTTTTIKWCEENYISCGMSPRLCDLLYKNGDYQNYIIAETLRQKYMNINYEISFDNYIRVYENVEEMFDIMSEHWDFLEKLQEYDGLKEMDEEQLVPIFKVKQTEQFFKFIFSGETTESLKVQYLNEFGSFKELKDSREFQKMICQEDNIELLGSWHLYHRIHNLLWESHPGHKGAFTRAWNKRWKEELSI